MDIFKKAANDLEKYMGNKIISYNQQSPSVLGNVLTHNSWNQGLPNFGGQPNPKPVNTGLINEQGIPVILRKPDMIIEKGKQVWDEVPNGQPVWSEKPIALPIPSAPVAATAIPQNIPNAQPPTSIPAMQFLKENIFPVTQKYNIPDAVAASQWAVESGRQTQSPINNVFGIGPNWQFPNLQANVVAYAQTVNNILQRKGFNPAQMTPAQIITALQSGSTRYEGHNPNPTTYVNTVMNTPEWRYFSQ